MAQKLSANTPQYPKGSKDTNCAGGKPRNHRVNSGCAGLHLNPGALHPGCRARGPEAGSLIHGSIGLGTRRASRCVQPGGLAPKVGLSSKMGNNLGHTCHLVTASQRLIQGFNNKTQRGNMGMRINKQQHKNPPLTRRGVGNS